MLILFNMKIFALAALAAAALATDDKVKVELYYESQCPGCRQTITTSFKQAFAAEGFLDMAEVQLVPYGNASEKEGVTGLWEFTCQHGETECVYNSIETCALDILADVPMDAFNFVLCIEENDKSTSPSQDYNTVVDKCAESAITRAHKFKASEIKNCPKNRTGNLQEHHQAVLTDALDPKHTYVPWVVAQGVHNDAVQNAVQTSLLAYVCSEYKGSKRSPDCDAATDN